MDGLDISKNTTTTRAPSGANKKERINQETLMENFDISKGVDDFLEVTIVDKGEKDEKQQIGRCQHFPNPVLFFLSFLRFVL